MTKRKIIALIVAVAVVVTAVAFGAIHSIRERSNSVLATIETSTPNVAPGAVATAAHATSTPMKAPTVTAAAAQASSTNAALEAPPAIPKVPDAPEAQTAASTSTSAPSPAPSPAAVSLPYSIGTFSGGFASGDGWTTDLWGSTSQSGGVMTVGANASTTGGEALLPGSASWTDYTFQATIDWEKGESFGLMARYVDENDYVVCEFDQQAVGTVSVILEQYVNGVRSDLAEGTVQNYNEMGGTGISAIIQVKGDQGACSFNYHAISTAVADDALAPTLAGGIGVDTWDPTMDNSSVVVRSIGVTAGQYDLGPDTIQGNYSAANQY